MHEVPRQLQKRRNQRHHRSHLDPFLPLLHYCHYNSGASHLVLLLKYQMGFKNLNIFIHSNDYESSSNTTAAAAIASEFMTIIVVFEGTTITCSPLVTSAAGAAVASRFVMVPFRQVVHVHNTKCIIIVWVFLSCCLWFCYCRRTMQASRSDQGSVRPSIQPNNRRDGKEVDDTTRSSYSVASS
jgi:hypothetical protein